MLDYGHAKVSQYLFAKFFLAVVLILNVLKTLSQQISGSFSGLQFRFTPNYYENSFKMISE